MLFFWERGKSFTAWSIADATDFGLGGLAWPWRSVAVFGSFELARSIVLRVGHKIEINLEIRQLLPLPVHLRRAQRNTLRDCFRIRLVAHPDFRRFAACATESSFAHLPTHRHLNKFKKKKQLLTTSSETFVLESLPGGCWSRSSHCLGQMIVSAKFDFDSEGSIL